MTFLGQAVETLRQSHIKEDTTPVLFVCDEAANIPIVNLKEIAGVGRGRRFALALFYQNLSQGYDQYGEHGFNAILGSITTKTFLPGCDDITAQYAARLVGQTTVWGHSFDDAPGTQYDKTRTTEAARPLIDPAEVRQLLKHKQAITITETMPPVKWTFPPSAKTPPRKLPHVFGYPCIISLPEAEARTAARRLREENAKRPDRAAQKSEEKTSTPQPAASANKANNADSRADSRNSTEPQQEMMKRGETTEDATKNARAESLTPTESIKAQPSNAQQSLTITRGVTSEQAIESATDKGLTNLAKRIGGARPDITEKYLNQRAT